MTDGTNVAGGTPIGTVQDQGKNTQGRPLSRVEISMVPVTPPTGPDRVDVMDPIVAAGWTEMVEFDDTAWTPKPQ